MALTVELNVNDGTMTRLPGARSSARIARINATSPLDADRRYSEPR
jgi:hypothetical protein